MAKKITKKDYVLLFRGGANPEDMTGDRKRLPYFQQWRYRGTAACRRYVADIVCAMGELSLKPFTFF